MKRVTGFRVKKRDGRFEWLRATKLMRSMGLAIAASRGEAFDLASSGLTGEEWRTADLTAAILTGLRNQHGTNRPLPTSVIADAVQQVLLVTGFPRAAEEYARMSGEQRRRRSALSRCRPPTLAESIQANAAAAPADVLGSEDGPRAGGRSVGGGRV